MQHTATAVTANVFRRLLQQLLLVGFLGAASAQLNNAGTLSNDPRLTKLVQLLDRAGISPSVGTTIFAPSTAAFNRYRDLDVNLWNKYASKSEFFVHLRQILEWHLVTEDALTTDQIFDGSRLQLENAAGNITIDQQLKKIDNVAFTDFAESNITTNNGIVHVIDKVLVPPYMTINLVEHMLTRDPNQEFDNVFRFTTFANLVLIAGLGDLIDQDYENGVTVLVPPNRRFNRAQIDVPALLRPENRIYVQEFVKAHMIRDAYHETGVFAYNAENQIQQFTVKSELGTSLWITTTGNRLRFQSREVLLADQVARNGYVGPSSFAFSCSKDAHGCVNECVAYTEFLPLSFVVTLFSRSIFHVVDLPMPPPDISDFTELMAISTSWDSSDCFRFFRQALITSREISQMMNSSLTMFCPTREAFAAFNNEDFNRLQEPIWVRHGTEFLMNHITYPAMTREELVDMAPGFITMLNGATYELRRSGERPRIKNTQFEQARSEFGDLVAIDGCVCIITSEDQKS